MVEGSEEKQDTDRNMEVMWGVIKAQNSPLVGTAADAAEWGEREGGRRDYVVSVAAQSSTYSTVGVHYDMPCARAPVSTPNRPPPLAYLHAGGLPGARAQRCLVRADRGEHVHAVVPGA